MKNYLRLRNKEMPELFVYDRREAQYYGKISPFVKKFLKALNKNNRGIRLILEGVPGSGKTAIGRVISGMTGIGFQDMDDWVSYQTDKKVGEHIINMRTKKDYLDDKYLDFEEEVVKTLHLGDKAKYIIATSGSNPLRIKSMDHLRGDNGIVVLLEADKNLLSKRMTDREEGLTQVTGSHSMSVADLIEYRKTFYEKNHNLRIDFGKETNVYRKAEEVLSRVTKVLERDNKFSVRVQKHLKKFIKKIHRAVSKIISP